MALDELKLYSVPSTGEVLLYPVYVAPVELGVVFLYSSETANVVTLHDLSTAESAGGGGSTGTGAWTNGNDTASGVAVETLVGAGSWTNANDTSAGVAAESLTGTGAWTNGDDTASGAARETLTAAGSWTNANDTMAATGAQSAGGSTGTGAWTSADDTAAGVALQFTPILVHAGGGRYRKYEGF